MANSTEEISAEHLAVGRAPYASCLDADAEGGTGRITGAMTGPSAWLGSELKASNDWIYTFTSEDIEEIETAVRSVNHRKLDILQIGREDFKLPTLTSKIFSIRRDILRGRGFVLLRGLPIDRYSLRDSAIAYWGLGTFLGYPVSQNARGHMLGHVYDLRQPNVRRYATNEDLRFHSDFSDIVGLLCLNSAKSGGESFIASGAAIHNELLRTRPDLLEVLYQPFWTDRRNETPEGMKPYYQLPVFFKTGDTAGMMYHRLPILMSERHEELPRLTDLQKEAIATVDEIAANPKYHLSMSLQKGDIQFLNNFAVIHARNAFEDFPEIERRRHLLRLWLVTPEDGCELTYWHYRAFGGGRRGGIYVGGAYENAPLDPASGIV